MVTEPRPPANAIVLQRRFLTIAESWFAPPQQLQNVDLLRCMQLPEPLPRARSQPFATKLIRLEATETELFEDLQKDTRREIRRAADRDGAVSEVAIVNEGTLNAFADFYDRFAQSRNLPVAGRERLERLAGNGMLALTRVTLADAHDPVVWHLYVVVPPRARLLLSASLSGDGALHAQAIGRANRLLHWRDMLHFQSAAYATYDLGGWYGGTADRARAGIDRFKNEFGGELAVEYNCVLGLSMSGRVAAAAQRLLEGVRKTRRALQTRRPHGDRT